MKKSSNRMTRISDEVKREVANVIRMELKDPRVQSMTTVTKATVTNDLKHAKIFVSILGNEKDKEKVLEGLKNASGYIRRQLATKINLRNTPELKFVIDDSLETSFRINKLIEEANRK